MMPNIYLQIQHVAGFWSIHFISHLYYFLNAPYHKLVKDDKLISDQLNNPVNDCKKAKDLLLDEIARWNLLPDKKRRLFASLLKGKKEFEGFLSMVNAEHIDEKLSELIKNLYVDKICQHANLDILIKQYPCELAYALALIDTTDHRSITPGWVLHNYPEVEFVMKLLRHSICNDGCVYCNTQLNVLHNLKVYFGYEQFRTYEGEPLQEQAAQAAVNGKSLLSNISYWWWKITHLPITCTHGRPFCAWTNSCYFTVTVSDEDQVDNLANKGITDAVTINGLLDPITRALSI